jgi:HPt (histidine-containing phosphotransfer) domain-containing protein
MQIEIPNDLFVFDQQDFDMRFEGSKDIAVEVIQTFFDEFPKDLVKIKESILSSNPKEIISTTHYFKGSCSYLSAKRAVWILNYMMDLAKNDRLDLMDKLFELLENEIKSLIFSIKEYLK